MVPLARFRAATLAGAVALALISVGAAVPVLAATTTTVATTKTTKTTKTTVTTTTPNKPLWMYGANNWWCSPTARRPTPVVLVHGTLTDQDATFDSLARSLKQAGYCVYALNYGNYGTNAVASSAAELRTFVNKVLAATRASKVSIVGHSQGGTMPRYYIKKLGGAAKVDDLVALAPANHGSTWTELLASLTFSCQACHDLVAGSSFLRVLNQGDESPGAVSYTNVVTSKDAVVVPYTSGYLKAAPNVSNLRIQDYCPKDKVRHFNVPFDVAAIRITLNALGRRGPANPAYRPGCS
ncbi:MAG: lipase, class 2 [Marmoricola sp.]|nr:lipase, class 2 [Marmoricola sp.]